jgi:hypothetical protein
MLIQQMYSPSPFVLGSLPSGSRGLSLSSHQLKQLQGQLLAVVLLLIFSDKKTYRSLS